MSKIKKGNLSIDSVLVDFIEKEAIPETDINIENFWKEFDEAVHELAPINKQLLEKRDSIQKQIDEWHLSNKGKEINKEEYFKFLKSINYIVEEKEDFKISTANVDDEIAQIAGPQLVCLMQDGEVFTMLYMEQMLFLKMVELQKVVVIIL